ncbi:MAG TPA: hypothetical protein VGD88_17180 [Opitutaceae bacterium]
MRIPQFRSLLAGLIFAFICFVAAPLLMFVNESRLLVAVTGGLGIVVIAYRTVEWGAVLGYRIQRADGTLSGENVSRCLVMTAILVGAVFFLATPFIAALVKIVR